VRTRGGNKLVIQPMTYTCGVDKASAQSAAPVVRGSGWCQTVQKPNRFVGSSELIFFLLKEGSILDPCYEIWGVTILIIIRSVNYRVSPPPIQVVSLFENIFKLSQKILTKIFRFSYSVLYPRVKVKVSPQHAVQAHKRPEGMAPLILNLGARSMWLFNATHRSLVPWERAWLPIWQDARSGSGSLSQGVKKWKSLSPSLVFDLQLSSS